MRNSKKMSQIGSPDQITSLGFYIYIYRLKGKGSVRFGSVLVWSVCCVWVYIILVQCIAVWLVMRATEGGSFVEGSGARPYGKSQKNKKTGEK